MPHASSKVAPLAGGRQPGPILLCHSCMDGVTHIRLPDKRAYIIYLVLSLDTWAQAPLAWCLERTGKGCIAQIFFCGACQLFRKSLTYRAGATQGNE